MIRVGFGFDIHQLREGVDFYLGGIQIDHPQGAFGHSDADALLHAIIEAILGAANLGNIGTHFPDTDPAFKNADSKILLAKAVELVHSKGYKVSNVDSTICLEAPKIMKHAQAMREVIAPILQVDLDDVSIKATTSEKMGFVGREEGIAVYAVALISRVQKAHPDAQ